MKLNVIGKNPEKNDKYVIYQEFLKGERDRVLTAIE